MDVMGLHVQLVFGNEEHVVSDIALLSHVRMLLV